MHLQIRARLLPFVVAFAVTACGGDDPVTLTQNACVNTQFGTFTGNATSTAAGALAGCAYYSVGTTSSGSTFALILTNQTGTTASPTISLGRSGTRPGTGTYTVSTSGASNFSGTVSVNPNRTFLLSTGTVTITSSSATGVAGSLNITGTEVGASSTITVSGDFSAKCFSSGSQGGTTFSC